MMRRLVALAGLMSLLLLGACGQRAIVSEKPLTEVHALLAGADELPPVFGSAEPDLRMETEDPNAVSWVLSTKGEEVMRFVATLTPDGPTKTSVDLAVKAPPKFEKRLNDNASVRDFYLTAMREQVESTLEGRPYDVTRTYAAMQKAVAANIGNISRDMEAAAAADHKREADNMRKAYEREAAGENVSGQY